MLKLISDSNALVARNIEIAAHEITSSPRSLNGRSFSSPKDSNQTSFWKTALLLAAFFTPAIRGAVPTFPSAYAPQIDSVDGLTQPSFKSHSEMCPAPSPFNSATTCRIEGLWEDMMCPNPYTEEERCLPGINDTDEPEPIDAGSLDQEAGAALLLEAVLKNDLKEIRELLSKGIDPNLSINDDGMRLIHFAATDKTLSLLIEAGAKIDKVDIYGRTAVHHAAMRGDGKTITFLAQHGAKLDKVDNEGKSAVILAVESDQPGSLLALVNAGADIDLKDSEGNTALHKAASKRQIQNIRLLLEWGADPKILNDDLETAFMVCKAQKKLANEACALAFKDGGKSEEIHALKFLSHAWGIKGELTIRAQIVNLEGAYSHSFFSDVAQSLKAFSQQFPLMLNSKTAESMSDLLTRNGFEAQDQNLNQLFSDYQKGLPVIIQTGFREGDLGHAVIVYLHGKYIVIANKGAKGRQALEVYKTKKIDKDFIIETIQLKRKAPKVYQQWLENLPVRIGAHQDALSKHIAKNHRGLPVQLVGNCSFKSLETAFLAIFPFIHLGDSVETAMKNGKLTSAAVERLNKAQDNSENWVHFNRLFAFEQYLSQLDPKAGSTSTIDQALTLTLFEKIWKHKKYKKFIELVSRIEKMYLNLLDNQGKLNYQAHKDSWTESSFFDDVEFVKTLDKTLENLGDGYTKIDKKYYQPIKVQKEPVKVEEKEPVKPNSAKNSDSWFDNILRF